MPSPGELLADRYELVQQIGAGGMATVWRARDTRLRRHVAVKLLRPELADDEDLVRRFESEARHAASLSHPNVATVYDTDVDAGRAFIVMELVDGPTVAEAIAERGVIEPEVAVEIAASAARALAAAHRRGLIHRDVKSANLLLGRDGRVRLADFGIARALTVSRLTQPGTVLGSIPYLSPEQARGEEATAKGDIFSLGVVLFEMLTGRLPWEAETPAAVATMRLHVPAPVPSAIIRSLPAGLDTIVGRALAIDPEERYPSARVFADALKAWSRRHGRRGKAGATRAATALALEVASHAGPRRSRDGLARTGSGSRASGRAVAVPAGGAFSIEGSARPNPWASPPAGRGQTRRGLRQPRRAAAADAGASEPTSAAPTRDRDRSPMPAALRMAVAWNPAAPSNRGALLLGLLAGGWVAIVLAVFLLGGRDGPGFGAGDLASATAPPIAILTPSTLPPTPSLTAIPTTSPTMSPTARPTPLATTAPTPAATSRPTPVPTAAQQVSAPARAVSAFYDAVEGHDWETAIDLWSPSMQQRYPVQEWLIDRFKRTTRIDITSLRTISVDEEAGRARVAVSLVEYRTVEPSPRRFVGAWDLVRIDGRWLLDDPDF